jgi:CRISPR-associated protein Cas2
MMVIVVYDISTITEDGQRRLRRISDICKDYGQRVQNSVFECIITPAQLVEMSHEIREMISDSSDSVRIYNIGNNWKSRVWHIGAKEPRNLEDVFII